VNQKLKKLKKFKQHDQSSENGNRGKTSTHISKIINLDEPTDDPGITSNEDLERQIALLEKRIELEEKLYQSILKRKQIEDIDG
jgi:hypothetical protein